MVTGIAKYWSGVCEEAGLTEIDRKLLWDRPFLNAFAFEDLDGKYARLAKLANDLRKLNGSTL